jgi:hypothetical protein
MPQARRHVAGCPAGGRCCRWRTSGGAAAAEVCLQGLRCIGGHSVQVGWVGIVAGSALWNVALLHKLGDAPAGGRQVRWVGGSRGGRAQDRQAGLAGEVAGSLGWQVLFAERSSWQAAPLTPLALCPFCVMPAPPPAVAGTPPPALAAAPAAVPMLLQRQRRRWCLRRLRRLPPPPLLAAPP